MPTYTVTDPQTGRKLKLTGESPPTEQELEQIFSDAGEKPKPVAAKNPVNPIVKMGAEYLKERADMYRAVGHHAGNLPVGLAQTAVNMFGGDEAAGKVNNYAQNREAQYQAEVPDSFGSYLGATVGEVAPWMLGAPAKGMQAIDTLARKVPGIAGRILSRAGQGAAVVPFVPAIGNDYWGEKGTQAAAGVIAPNVVAGLLGAGRGVANLGRHVLAPQSVADSNLARMIEPTPENIATLRAAGQDGYQPTTARVIGGTQAVGAEKALRNNPNYSPAFVDVDNANDAWRMGIVRKIAGADSVLPDGQAPESLMNARKERAAAVRPYTDENLQAVSASEIARSRAIAQQNLESLKPTQAIASDEVKSAKYKETPDIVRTKDGARKLEFNKDKDDFRVWLAANGGVSPDVVKFMGIDPKALSKGKNNVVVNAYNNALVRKDGMSQGQLREKMQEQGWLQPDEWGAPPKMGDNEAMQILSDSIHGGQKVYHPDSGARYMRQENQNYADDYARDVQLGQDVGTTPESFRQLVDMQDGEKVYDDFLPSAQARGTMVDPAPTTRVLKDLALSPNTTVSGAARSQLALIRDNMDGTGKVSAAVLDGIRQNANGTLAQNAPALKGVGTQEGKLYAPVASQIIRSLEREVSGYRGYLKTYADKSRPVNTIEAGYDLLRVLDSGGRNATGDSRITLNQSKAFNKALDKKRYGIDPEARKQFNAIDESLKRDSITSGNTLNISGSSTNYNAQSQSGLASMFFGDMASKDVGGGMLSKLVGGAAGAGVGATTGNPYAVAAGGAAGFGYGNDISRFINRRIMDKYAKGMLSPAEAADALERVLEKNPKQARELLIKNPAWRTLLALPQNEPTLDAGMVTKPRQIQR
jgi:hypothetical protein